IMSAVEATARVSIALHLEPSGGKLGIGTKIVLPRRAAFIFRLKMPGHPCRDAAVLIVGYLIISIVLQIIVRLGSHRLGVGGITEEKVIVIGRNFGWVRGI